MFCPHTCLFVQLIHENCKFLAPLFPEFRTSKILITAVTFHGTDLLGIGNGSPPSISKSASRRRASTDEFSLLFSWRLLCGSSNFSACHVTSLVYRAPRSR